MNNWLKNTVLFLSSQIISFFGSTLVQYAITWYITIETQSGIMMTISIICGFFPMFIMAPFTGVWADRFNRKILIILSDSLIAIATLILALVFIAGYDSLVLLFVASAVRSFGGAIQQPAVGALLPQLVPEDKLMKVNATSSSLQALVTLISPMISGTLLTFASIEVIFFIDVVTAAIAIFILINFVQVATHAKALDKEKTEYFSDFREGVHYILNHAYVRTFFIFNAIFLIFVSPLAFLTPLQVARSFGDDVWRLSTIEVTFSAGMMLGGIIMTKWSGFNNKIHTMVFSNFIIAICTVALGIVPNFWIYSALMLIIGVTLPIFNTPATVLLQQKVEGDFLGRVFGVLGMIASSMMPLGMLFFGPVADYVKIEYLLIVTGILMFVQTVFMLANKVLLEAGKPVVKNINE